MRKLTTQEVADFLGTIGYTLESEYVNSRTTILVRCNKGHQSPVYLHNLRKGQGCAHCAGNVPYTLTQVRDLFVQQGFQLLDEVYTNNHTPLACRCRCDHLAQVSLSAILNGQEGCEACRNQAISLALRTDRNEMAEFCREQGCVFLDAWISNKKTRIAFRCACGRESYAYWSNFRRCPNCKSCGDAKKSGDKCYRWNPDREYVAMAKRFRKTCGQFIRRALNGRSKDDHTHKLLGYTPKQLQEHILGHPDYREGEPFHVDHIWPIQAFLDHGITDLRVINCLENLRPMPGPENVAKGSTYDKEGFERWLAKKLG